MATVDIIVPSYGRSDILGRCLDALLQQHFRDIEVLCVCRTNDAETKKTIEEFRSRDSRIREVPVSEPGFVAALNAGFKSAQAPFVAFTDDDAEAPPQWMETIINHFAAHPECGAAGGPDRLQVAKESFRNPPPAKKVGVYSWTGKWHATHHCPIREEFLRVQILKGVNMVYRHELIRGMEIGEGLNSLMCTEPGIAARVRKNGFELHFLRDAWVLHHCAPRQESEDRTNSATAFAVQTTSNYAYTLWRYQPLFLALVVQIRNLVIGSRHIPGILRVPVAPAKASLAFRHSRASLDGAWRGLLARFGCA
jgi:cellulose synthase/poly-beta-1,6-N-acetylglucosamine synthase-like glycosyltransferase